MLSLSQINIRDPFVLFTQGRYYLYGTRGETCWGPASGFDVYVSRDLETWSEPQACFENDGTFWADRNYWAPEVHRWKDHSPALKMKPAAAEPPFCGRILPWGPLCPGQMGR